MRKGLAAVLFLVSCSFLLAQQALNNDAIVKMVKAGLSDDLIVTTINASPGSYDTSANGLIALKQGGASDKVIAAVVTKAAAPAGLAVAPPAQASTSTGRPLGIDDVGVYYRDKSGAWVALMPEIVNFKTGGVLKNIASAGLVKGDVNGHIQGPHAKLSLTFPVVLAVYVPEGTDITEYQLLHLRPGSDSREFRSVTGGVMHVSGGATRDNLEFQPEKLAPRVFQITLQAGLGKGEFGLLPPGAVGSSNMGSSGKIYALSIIE
ncbi:MAG: hypothetical protein ABSF23_08085 [Terracidiphilus sp.]|jgi:hypothetical protein